MIFYNKYQITITMSSVTFGNFSPDDNNHSMSGPDGVSSTNLKLDILEFLVNYYKTEQFRNENIRRFRKYIKPTLNLKLNTIGKVVEELNLSIEKPDNWNLFPTYLEIDPVKDEVERERLINLRDTFSDEYFRYEAHLYFINKNENFLSQSVVRYSNNIKLIEDYTYGNHEDYNREKKDYQLYSKLKDNKKFEFRGYNGGKYNSTDPEDWSEETKDTTLYDVLSGLYIYFRDHKNIDPDIFEIKEKKKNIIVVVNYDLIHSRGWFLVKSIRDPSILLRPI